MVEKIFSKDAIQGLLKIVDVNFKSKASEIAKTISEKFNDNKSILHSPTEDEYFQQGDVTFKILKRLNDNFDLKPININLKNDGKKEKNDKGMVKVDVFSEENIEKELLVYPDFLDKNQFMVVFNKFPILKEHILLVVKNFELQYTHLCINAFENALLLTNFLNGICIFNGGANAGASQPRKHMQVVPKTSFKELNFGLFKYFSDYISLEKLEKIVDKLSKKEDKEITSVEHNEQTKFEIVDYDDFAIYFTLEIFQNRKHLFAFFRHDLSQVNTLNCGQLAEVLHKSYRKVLLKLKLSPDEEDKEITHDYSLILTTDYFFVTPRETHIVLVELNQKNPNYDSMKSKLKEFDTIKLNLNTFAFFCHILVKDNEERDYIKGENLFEKIIDKL